MIKVMIVDGSAVVRSVLQEVLQAAPEISVMAAVPDPLLALAKMVDEWPDVIIADIEMQRMDAISFVKQVMEHRPTPIVVCSSLTEAGSKAAFEAIEAGAFSLITKAALNSAFFLRSRSQEIIATVRAASLANMRGNIAARRHRSPRAEGQIAVRATHFGRSADRVIAIGIATGGIQALEHVLTNLPADTHGLVIVQQMPAEFTRQFINRLSKRCQLEIKEAEDGDRIRPGRALIVSSDKQMRVKQTAAHYCVEVVAAPPSPSAMDLFFRSVASAVGANALGIIMTGMGDDGARGLKELFDCGAQTAAQDEATSVVYGMPKEAFNLGAVQHVVSLYDFPEYICQFSH